MNFLRKFLKNRSGSLATMTGALAVPLLMAMGVAIDYTILNSAQSKLQDAADSAALASARELGLAGSSDTVLTQVAEQYVYSSLSTGGFVDASPSNLTITTDVGDNNEKITVEMDYYWTPLLIHYISDQAMPIKATATASLAGSESLCVVALDGSTSSSLAMTGKSSITANNCAVYSNSTSTKGLSIVSGAKIASSNTYTAGGYSGPLAGYTPKPVTDSPAIDDPLASRAAPSVGSCDYTNMNFGKSATLNPGVYCGGISITGKTTITLKPGVYVMKDGPLSLGGNSTIKGANVGFYFTGSSATFDFGVSTQIDITAPTSGAMAGILFYEDRASTADREFILRSKDAERLEGTVYLPKGKLVIDKASRVGQLSDWTAIIAKQIQIKEGPQIQINSNYAGSSIPVPDGVGNLGKTARLTH